MARPTKYTADRHREIVLLTRLGFPKAHAARAVGIDVSTLDDWLRKGESPRSQYHQLHVDFRQAEAGLEQTALVAINKQIQDGDGKLALDFLQKRFPKEWHPTTKHEHAGPDGGPINVDTGVALLPPLDPDGTAGETSEPEAPARED